MRIGLFIDKLMSFLIFVVCTIIFAICLCLGYNWYMDNKKTDVLTTDIRSSVIISDSSDGLNTDFSTLIAQNSDTVGWIRVENTKIDYPIVKTSDNDFYLTHSFDQSYNDAGWVFMDFRNDFESLSKNTIIYAHSRLDKSMFGSLKTTLSDEWYNNSDNHFIKTSSMRYNYTWEVFSTYIIDDEVYYLTTGFDSDEEYINFLGKIKSRSNHNYNVELTSDDVILTLSTCYGDTQKMVVHAKLIKTSINTSYK